VFIATAAAIYSLGHGLCTFTAVPRSTQPSTLRGAAKCVSAYGLSNINNGDDGGCGWLLPIFGGLAAQVNVVLVVVPGYYNLRTLTSQPVRQNTVFDRQTDDTDCYVCAMLARTALALLRTQKKTDAAISFVHPFFAHCVILFFCLLSICNV